MGWAFASGLDAPAGTLAGSLAASHGLAHADAVPGHGIGLIAQGLGFFVFDGIAYAGSRARVDGLRSLVERVEVGVVPGTVDVTLVSLGL